MKGDFVWEHLIAVADGLASKAGAKPSDFRSSVSRAYYSAYGEAKKFAVEHGYVKPDSVGSHEGVHDFLTKAVGVAKKDRELWIDAGGSLRALKAERRNADHEAGVPFAKTDAASAVSAAKDIVENLKDLSKK